MRECFESKCETKLTVLPGVANDDRGFRAIAKEVDGLNFNLIGREGVRVIDDVATPPIGCVVLPLLPGIPPSPPNHVAQFRTIPFSVLQWLRTGQKYYRMHVKEYKLKGKTE